MVCQHPITIEPGKRRGRLCIRSLRITVYDVLEYLASGMTEGEILRDLPDLTREDISACLAFAADREHAYVIVTKDFDFHQRSFFFGAPPKATCIRRGNCSTAEIESILRNRHADVAAFQEDADAALLARS